MWWLRQCPRCGCDLHTEISASGVEIVCLQCGHTLTARQEQQLGMREPVKVRAN